jgi:predicted metal-binding membrane protein
LVSHYVVGEDNHQLAVLIAQKLRGLGCEIVNFVPTETAVLRRDRIVVILALTVLTALAWSYLLWLSADMAMGGMDMTGFRMIPSGMGLMVPGHTPWQAMEFAFVFAMWTVMMVSMMTPSAAPMILMYARAGRHAAAQGTPLAATIWFVTGYFLVWVAFALLATFVQWALERTVLLDSAMASTSNILGGLLFVAAGSYQWTQLKDVCLAQCQRPFAFLIRQGGFRRDAPGSLMLGLRHGAYCVGCCWVLMTLLLVGGVMNVLWIALLALLIILEKVTSFGRPIAHLAGIVLVAAGAWLFSMGMS